MANTMVDHPQLAIDTSTAILKHSRYSTIAAFLNSAISDHVVCRTWKALVCFWACWADKYINLSSALDTAIPHSCWMWMWPAKDYACSKVLEVDIKSHIWCWCYQHRRHVIVHSKMSDQGSKVLIEHFKWVISARDTLDWI